MQSRRSRESATLCERSSNDLPAKSLPSKFPYQDSTAKRCEPKLSKRLKTWGKKPRSKSTGLRCIHPGNRGYSQPCSVDLPHSCAGEIHHARPPQWRLALPDPNGIQS